MERGTAEPLHNEAFAPLFTISRGEKEKGRK